MLSWKRQKPGRKQVEQRLALAAAQWQDTFDAIEDAVMILDKDFRVVRANQAMNKAFAGAKVLGAHCYELFHGTEGNKMSRHDLAGMLPGVWIRRR